MYLMFQKLKAPLFTVPLQKLKWKKIGTRPNRDFAVFLHGKDSNVTLGFF